MPPTEKTPTPKTVPRQTARSRFTPQPVVGLRLEERDERLLCDLFLHRFLSRGQLEALYFTSTVRCNARLRQLFGYGFVKRYYLPAAPYGAQAIYSIGKQAVPLVARRLDWEADEVAEQYRRSRTPSFIEHTLEVANVWLAFHEACAKDNTIRIERWLPELLCRHEYEIGQGGGRTQREVFKPDAFIRLQRGDSQTYLNYFVEVDLGHTSSRQLLGKLWTHQRYLESGLFAEIFGCTQFQTLVITTTPRRLRNLCSLVEAQQSDLFWFTTFEAIKQSGIASTIWQRPFAPELMSLSG